MLVRPGRAGLSCRSRFLGEACIRGLHPQPILPRRACLLPRGVGAHAASGQSQSGETETESGTGTPTEQAAASVAQTVAAPLTDSTAQIGASELPPADSSPATQSHQPQQPAIASASALSLDQGPQARDADVSSTQRGSRQSSDVAGTVQQAGSTGQNADALDDMLQASSSSLLHVAPLAERDLGVLRGGSWPFMYDPVYGLPVVHQVAKYGEVLRDVREGAVSQVLWFHEPPTSALPAPTAGRCLVRYHDGGVRQAVLPPNDLRMQEAMSAAGVPSVVIPAEPRHVAISDAGAASGDFRRLDQYQRFMAENVFYHDKEAPLDRRGPRLGPTFAEWLLADPAQDEARQEKIDGEVQQVLDVVASAERYDSETWEDYQRTGSSKGHYSGTNRRPAGRVSSRPSGQDEIDNPELQVGPRSGGWMDTIVVSQNTQALINRYVPIVGPIIGSALIIGLYMLTRLMKGDLTDRLKVGNLEEDKKKSAGQREARMKFLEAEIPSLVARNTSLEELQTRARALNKRFLDKLGATLGGKLEISPADVEEYYEAAKIVVKQGIDATALASGIQASNKQAVQSEEAEADAERAAAGAGGAVEEDPMGDMGKLKTARIQKAIDPTIQDVKRKMRAAKKKQKRESKVTLDDEVIFFDDVAGNEQAKLELAEVIDFFRKPERFRDSGARVPKGVLLIGPPGNGKTLMARAVAGESGVGFISANASEFIEMYMGLGASRVRDLFNTARELAPCIIFIDELDAVGRARNSGGMSNDERDNTVNQLLAEMDGFEAEQQGIVVMGATNRKDVLDIALTRPGRFDRSIEVRRPDFMGRLEAFKVHLRDKPIDEDIIYEELAGLAGGMSGAQVAGVVNNACFLASRAGRNAVAMEDLVASIQQAKYGKSYDPHKFISPARRRRFAVMEASISMTATLMPAIEPVDYVTISPSIKSPLGRTVLVPSVARHSTGVWTRRYLREQLLVALAGRAGEEVVFGVDELSSLNQHRIMNARQIVTKMINSGFSKHPDYENIRTLGSQYYDPSTEPGRWQMTTITADWHQSQSEWVDIDMEMESTLNDTYAETRALLVRNRSALDKLVELLLERETVSGEEVRDVVLEYATLEDLERRSESEDVDFM